MSIRQETSPGNGNYVDCSVEVPPVAHIRDATGGNNKTWTVPGGRLWKVTRMCVRYTSSAAVGNRVMTIVEEDADGNRLQHLAPGKSQAASLEVKYCCLQGIFRETTVINGSLQVPIPSDFYIPAGHVLRVFDEVGISIADGMVVNLHYVDLRV